MKDSAWWDRVSTVMDMAAANGYQQMWLDGGACCECGSQFPGHRCHMEDPREP